MIEVYKVEILMILSRHFVGNEQITMAENRIKKFNSKMESA
jgi:hypothetical protein